MKYCSNFRHDLELGQIAEKEIGLLLSEKKIEIKKDMLVEKLIIFLPTEELKKLIEPLKKTKRDVRGGDNNTSRGILLPLTTLIPTNE